MKHVFLMTSYMSCEAGEMICHDQDEPEALELSEITAIAVWDALNARTGLKPYINVAFADVSEWLQEALDSKGYMYLAIAFRSYPPNYHNACEHDTSRDGEYINMTIGTQKDADFITEALATDPSWDQNQLLGV